MVVVVKLLVLLFVVVVVFMLNPVMVIKVVEGVMKVPGSAILLHHIFLVSR